MPTAAGKAARANPNPHQLLEVQRRPVSQDDPPHGEFAYDGRILRMPRVLPRLLERSLNSSRLKYQSFASVAPGSVIVQTSTRGVYDGVPDALSRPAHRGESGRPGWRSRSA